MDWIRRFVLHHNKRLGAYRYLDLTPKGRNETGPSFDLTDLVRHHDRYPA